MPPLKSRRYMITWHFRHQDPENNGNVPELVEATSVLQAINKLIKILNEEYADARRDVVVIEVREV